MGRIKARYQTKHYNKFARGTEKWRQANRRPREEPDTSGCLVGAAAIVISLITWLIL